MSPTGPPPPSHPPSNDPSRTPTPPPNQAPFTRDEAILAARITSRLTIQRSHASTAAMHAARDRMHSEWREFPYSPESAWRRQWVQDTVAAELRAMAEKRAQRAAAMAAGRSVAEQDRRARAEIHAAQERVDALWRDFPYSTGHAERGWWVDARVAGELGKMEGRRGGREEEFRRRVGEEVRGAVEALRARGEAEEGEGGGREDRE